MKVKNVISDASPVNSINPKRVFSNRNERKECYRRRHYLETKLNIEHQRRERRGFHPFETNRLPFQMIFNVENELS